VAPVLPPVRGLHAGRPVSAVPAVTATWTDAGATFSPCGVYRYTLWRAWEVGPTVCWVMLNPSTADATKEDPTIRKCIGYARRWGFGAVAIVNLFALRSTNPRALYGHAAPVGPQNDAAIVECVRLSRLVVAAWGVHGEHCGRGDAVLDMLRLGVEAPVHCLGTTKDGHPKHPLYLRGDLEPEVMP
jgi:hypothetical protein